MQEVIGEERDERLLVADELRHELTAAIDASRVEFPDFCGVLVEARNLLDHAMTADQPWRFELQLAASRANAALEVWRSLHPDGR
jgi:hypothetical protein